MVDTPIFETGGAGEYLETLKEKGCVLKPSDIADGIVYVLSTPAHVQVLMCEGLLTKKN